ncbi:MAG: dockerin type I repeat-containing protein [Ruminococcus sp.]|nr:dockerin type I repeat-containing protein [Ruminococcus sp.]
MIKKIIAALTAILTVGCTSVFSVSAADLPDTDPTHIGGYISRLEKIEVSSQKVSPELFEKIKACFKFIYDSGEIVNIYAKQELMTRNPDDLYPDEPDLYDEIIITLELETPAITVIGLFDEDIDQDVLTENITAFIDNENVTLTTTRNSEDEMMVGMHFNGISDEEINDISVKTADMLSKNYNISRFTETFGGRLFEEWGLYYNQPFFASEQPVKITAEEIRNAGVKAEFDPMTGNITHDKGLSMEEIIGNIFKINELTGLEPYFMSSIAELPYCTTLDLSSKYLQYKIPDEVKKQINAGVAEISVVITYKDMSFDKINESYTSEVNNYKKLIARQSASKYTNEQKKQLIEDFKTKTWQTLVTDARESAVKSAVRGLGVTIDDVDYCVGKSEFVCTLTPEQVNTASLLTQIKSIRLLADGDDIEADNRAFYESFSPIEGDANGDRNVSISDAVRILQYMANPEKYALSPTLLVNADISDNDGVTTHDAAVIQQMDAGLL